MILYVVRLAVRLEGYALFIARHAAATPDEEEEAEGGPIEIVRGLELGVDLGREQLEYVKNAAQKLRAKVSAQRKVK